MQFSTMLGGMHIVCLKNINELCPRLPIPMNNPFGEAHYSEAKIRNIPSYNRTSNRCREETKHVNVSC